MLSSLAWYTRAADGESKINFSAAAWSPPAAPLPMAPPLPPPLACHGISESLRVSRSPSRSVSVVFATTNLDARAGRGSWGGVFVYKNKGEQTRWRR